MFRQRIVNNNTRKKAASENSGLVLWSRNATVSNCKSFNLWSNSRTSFRGGNADSQPRLSPLNQPTLTLPLSQTSKGTTMAWCLPLFGLPVPLLVYNKGRVKVGWFDEKSLGWLSPLSPRKEAGISRLAKLHSNTRSAQLVIVSRNIDRSILTDKTLQTFHSNQFCTRQFTTFTQFCTRWFTTITIQPLGKFHCPSLTHPVRGGRGYDSDWHKQPM
jgi:hypothetical protein